MTAWCSKQCDLGSTEQLEKGYPLCPGSALAHGVNEYWRNIQWIEITELFGELILLERGIVSNEKMLGFRKSNIKAIFT
ncbi:hypothetical protein BTVI_104310 [Pitangus sulphuratus]|nr:hypothetical protein BTVI_104310 [Pitangus sulphuratus]